MKSFLSNLIIVFSLMSCAAWRAENVSHVHSFPKKMKEDINKPNISYKLKKLEYLENGVVNIKPSSAEDLLKYSTLIEDVYKESNLFRMVGEESPNKQMSIEVEVTNEYKWDKTMSIVSWATLLLIPRKTIKQITVTTKFFNKLGELVGMVEKTDDVIIWYQTFMIVVTPFLYPSPVVTETIKDLARASLIEAYSGGYFVDINS